MPVNKQVKAEALCPLYHVDGDGRIGPNCAAKQALPRNRPVKTEELAALGPVPHTAEAGRIRPNCAARQAMPETGGQGLRCVVLVALFIVSHAAGAAPKQASKG